MKNLGKLTISIVNFNTGVYLSHLLKSLEEVRQEVEFEVWVVDNASLDNSLKLAKEKFPWVKFIESSENLGFGKAHNLVLKKLDSEYVLILNPDTDIPKGVIKYMVDFMDKNPWVGASTCKIVLADGSLDWAAHRSFPTPLASLLYFLGNDSLYHLTNRSMKTPHEVDGISGSFFLTRKSVLEKVGFFDEDFFLYAEDLDLSYRIKQAGFKIMYVPQVSIVHHKGVSSGLKKHSQKISTADLETRKKSLDAFYLTMKIFYKKHLEKNYPFFLNWLIFLGINLKWFLAKRSMRV